MFVVSVKSDNLKRIFALSIAFVVLSIGAAVYVFGSASLPAGKIGSITMKGETNEDRTAFFAQFSWLTSNEPLEIKEVVIPEEFDETYNTYNELQKKQGLDLTDYKGVRVKMYSYEILNYPSFENSGGSIRGNILTYNGTVIAGDISNIRLDGFMTTFDGSEENKITAAID